MKEVKKNIRILLDSYNKYNSTNESINLPIKLKIGLKLKDTINILDFDDLGKQSPELVLRFIRIGVIQVFNFKKLS